METLFRTVLGKDDLKVDTERLKTDQLASVMLLSEHSRRMLDMMENYKNQPELLKLFGDVKPEYTLVLNRNHPLVQKLVEWKNKGGDMEKTNLVCKQLYDLALLGQKQLDQQEMSQFIARSNQLMTWILEK